jgi:hypothetical protein
MELGAVREATLAAGTARLALTRFAEGQLPWEWEEGLTDLQRRRTATTMTLAEGDRVMKAILERWPWLEYLDDDDDDGSQTLHLGSATYHVAGERCVEISAGLETGPRGHADPTWIIDALAGAGETEPVAGESVREIETQRYATTLDLDRAERTLGGAFSAGPHDRRPLRADVWVDSEQRVRRVMWSAARGRCRRPGLLIRDPTCASGPRPWSMLELWDFGVAVDIPTPDHHRERAVLVRAAYHLWRTRRAWRREHSA